MYGLSLAAGAVLFWIAWLLMPGVGVTDAREIFTLVASQRSLVATSVVLQLVSAMLYAPAMVGVVGDARFGASALTRWGATLLVIGAMGSAADAVLHLLAYAMTAQGIDSVSLVPVMTFMQGPGLFLLAPLLLGFFVGGALLSLSLTRSGRVSRWNARLHLIGLAIAIAGGAFASVGLISSRLVGLAFLGLISASQVWLGITLSEARLGVTATAPRVPAMD